MANFDPRIMEAGDMSGPTLTVKPGGRASGPRNGFAVQPHHGLIGIVLLAVLVLFLLDKAGFRFAVTVGKR